MFTHDTIHRSAFFTRRALVAYLFLYALAAGAGGLGFYLSSVPWLAFGLWLATSLTVLLLDKAARERSPHWGRQDRPGLASLFRGSREALTLIVLLGLTALLVGFLAWW